MRGAGMDQGARDHQADTALHQIDQLLNSGRGYAVVPAHQGMVLQRQGPPAAGALQTGASFFEGSLADARLPPPGSGLNSVMGAFRALAALVAGDEGPGPDLMALDCADDRGATAVAEAGVTA
jgi:hypothetical protein